MVVKLRRMRWRRKMQTNPGSNSKINLKNSCGFDSAVWTKVWCLLDQGTLSRNEGDEQEALFCYLSLSDHLWNGDGREGHPSSHIEGATGNCKGGEHLESESVHWQLESESYMIFSLKNQNQGFQNIAFHVFDLRCNQIFPFQIGAHPLSVGMEQPYNVGPTRIIHNW